jgi:opacity protein-like surface antigen
MKHFVMAAMAVAALPAVAGAQDMGWVRDGAYARVEGGWSNLDDNSFNTGAGRVDSKYDDDGYIAGAAIGSKMGPWRAEIEALYSENDVKSNNLNGAALAGVDGKTKLTAGMVNGYYDFGQARFKPYVGGGVGYANVKLDNYRGGGTTLADDDDNVLAYQGIAGVSYELNPCWSINGEYRYIGTNDAEINTFGGGKSKVAYDSNNVMVGLSYKF